MSEDIRGDEVTSIPASFDLMCCQNRRHSKHRVPINLQHSPIRPRDLLLIGKRAAHHHLKSPNATNLLAILKANLHLKVESLPPIQVKKAEGICYPVEGVLGL